MGDLEYVAGVAQGGPFDVLEAVRTLARVATAAAPPASLNGLLNSRMVKVLAEAGFKTAADVREAKDADLLAVAGLTPKGVMLIREKVR